MEYYFNFPETLRMDSGQPVDSKKRTLGFMLTADLAGKLKSKQDFVDYLDKHRKYPPPTSLTSF